MSVEIKAIFQIIGKNPPSVLLVGGILMYLLGSFYVAVGKPDAAIPLLTNAPFMIGAGIILQILWPFRHQIGRSL